MQHHNDHAPTLELQPVGLIGFERLDNEMKPQTSPYIPQQQSHYNPPQPTSYNPPQPSPYIPPDTDDENGDDRTLLTNALAVPNNDASAQNLSLFLSQRSDTGDLMRIDYIIVYKVEEDEKKENLSAIRETYMENLAKAGLVLETVAKTKMDEEDTKVFFVKVHVPWEVLLTFAELMKMKLPLKSVEVVKKKEKSCCRFWNPMRLSEEYYNDEDDTTFTCPFRKDRLDMFMIPDEHKETFFTNAERSRICFEVLNRTKYSDRENKVDTCTHGIRRLLNIGAYESAFPLHEGPYKQKKGTEFVLDKENDRKTLYEIWAKPKQFYKYQPLDLIRKYFGEKIGIYFAWLGLYTKYLIPVSIIGCAAFFYGLGTFMSDTSVEDICGKDKLGDAIMCPRCDKACSYWRLNQSCLMSKITHLFDNKFTIAFSIIMACWGKLFLEYWRRKQAELQYDWDVSNFEENETIRPEFESKCKRIRINPVTGDQEPYMPPQQKCPRYTVSCFTVVFMVLLVLCAILGVITYRVIMVGVFFSVKNDTIRTYAKIVTTITAACINLIIILILNKVYTKISEFLTHLERPRTETQYEDRFTFKMYCFQFFNFYSSLFYIAFFKGSFSGRPGKYNYAMTGARGEECDPAGCLFELCIQMLIIFGGKQIINNVKELGVPMVMNALRRRKLKKQAEESNNVTGMTTDEEAGNGKAVYNEESDDGLPQWERDYSLVETPALCLFDEYLEMVIQFGFVTLFVSAMPLSPLFALCNNIIEIRLDAYKMLTQWRRPPADRAEDIGIWFAILQAIAAISVLTNALILGYTSDQVPKMVYQFYYSPDGSMHGYVNFTLSTFLIQDFENQSIPEPSLVTEYSNITQCLYRDFRLPPDGDFKYDFSSAFWHVLTARLAFVLLFEHFVFFLTTVIGWLIPNMSKEVRIEMMRERYLTQELMYKRETTKLQQQTSQVSQPPPESVVTNRNTNVVYPIGLENLDA